MSEGAKGNREKKLTEKYESLNDDQETGHDSPERTGWLIRNSATTEEQDEFG